MFASMMVSLVTLTLAQADAPQTIEAASAVITLVERVELPAHDAGVLVELRVREGDLVKRGDLLAELDPREAMLAMDRAKLEYDIAAQKGRNDVATRFAKKSADVAAAELRRAKEAVEKFNKSISESELDRLRLAAERGVLEVEQAELDQIVLRLTAELKKNELESAELAVDRRSLRSPLDGMVVEVKRQPGEWVKPGDAVLRIVRLDRLRAEGFLSAADAARVRVGAEAQFVLATEGGEPMRVAGRVAFVSPELDTVNGDVRFWVELDNSDLKLRPGRRGKILVTRRE